MVDKLPFLPDEHHYAITSVTARSAALDHMIEFTIAGLMAQRKNTAAFMLKQVGTDRLVKLLEALLIDIFPEEAAAIEATTQEITSLRQQRNEVTHWLSSATDDPQVAKFQSFRPFRENAPAQMKTAEDIQNIATGLLNCAKELAEWLERGSSKLTKDAHALASLEILVQQARRERLLSPSTQGPPETILRPDRPPKPSQE